MSLLEWLMSFGPTSLTQIRDVITKIQAIRAAEDLETQVKLSIELLELITTITPTAVDNDLLATLQRFVTLGLATELVKLVGRLTGTSVSVMSAEDQAVEIQQFQAQGIGFAEAIALARLIAKLIKMAQEFRDATV